MAKIPLNEYMRDKHREIDGRRGGGFFFVGVVVGVLLLWVVSR